MRARRQKDNKPRSQEDLLIFTPYNVSSVLRRLFSTAEAIQYCGGSHQYCGGCSILQGITSVLQGIASVLWGDSISTVEG